MLAWPPTPQLAFASLPCVAMAYMKVKKELLGRLETRWDRIIRGLPETDAAGHPAQGDVGGLREIINNIADGLQGAPEEEPDNDRVEVWFDEGEGQEGAGLVIDVVEEVEDEEEDGQEPNEGGVGAPRPDDLREGDRALGDWAEEEVAHEPQPEQVQQEEAEDPQEEAPAQPAPPPEPQRRPAPVDRAVRYSIRDLTSTILGALLLPSVSWAAGELLRLALPKAWTAAPPPTRHFLFAPSLRLGPAGLLQERWGRSLVGGCAWVVLKDVFRIYVKYRRAAIRPLRRVPSVKPRTERTGGAGGVAR